MFAIKIPSRGGDTLFANLAAAYEALPAATRARLDGLQARHRYNYNGTRRDGFDDETVDYFWNYDNNGLRVAQVYFLEIPQQIGLDP